MIYRYIIYEKRIAGILTIAIGDGGNELGMGKVHEEIITTIPEGDLIGKLEPGVLQNDICWGLVRLNKIICISAASISTMYLLTCGVSNWGCWALQFALGVLQGNFSKQKNV